MVVVMGTAAIGLDTLAAAQYSATDSCSAAASAARRKAASERLEVDACSYAVHCP